MFCFNNFLFSTIIIIFSNFLFLILNNNIFIIIISIALLIKIGRAPFHFWIPIVIENLNWLNNRLLITWQKIAPIILIFYVFKIKLLITFIILCLICRSIGGLNQTSIRKLMAFSSINQISWLLIRLIINEIIWLIYFIIYFIIIIRLTKIFNNLNLYYLNQFFSLNLKFFSIKISIFLNILSLRGLPPFLGFWPKFIIIKEILILNINYIIILIIIFSLLILFFYLRIIYSSIIFNSVINKNINFYYFNNKNLIFLTFLNHYFLIFIILFYF